MLWGTKRGWVLPENVPTNEFFNLEGRKFNTSTGWFVDPASVADIPVDAVRYALTTTMPETADSEFTWRDFQARVSDELADNFGNLVSRTARFVERFFAGKVPARTEPSAADAARNSEAYDVRKMTEEPLRPELEAAWRRTLQEVEGFRHFAERSKTPFVVVVVPYAFQLAVRSGWINSYNACTPTRPRTTSRSSTCCQASRPNGSATCSRTRITSRSAATSWRRRSWPRPWRRRSRSPR